MFTLEQIDDIHARLGRASTLLKYVRALHDLGVERYDSYVSDGHSEYVGQGGYVVRSPAMHELLIVADISDRDAFLDHLKEHEEGKTGYVELSRGLARSGVAKWTMDTGMATMTYIDVAGTALLSENLREITSPSSPAS